MAIESAGQRALILGDLAVHPAQITETEWAMAMDTEQELAVQARRQVLDRAEAEHMTLVACHFPDRGIGNLVREGGRRYWQALKTDGSSE